MKFFRVLAFVGLLGSVASATAADPPAPSARDVFRQSIAPLIDAFSRYPDGPNRALTLHWRVTEATAQPAELRGTRLTLICRTPDAYLFQFLALGTVCTVCRQGQSTWVAPADRFAPLLQQVQAKPLTDADREPLEPIRLTIPTRLFWALFYLLPVQDAGNASIGANVCRRVSFHPPESKKGESLRLWISGADVGAGAGPVKTRRVDLIGPDSHSSLDVEDEQLSPFVPATSFEPDASMKDSVLRVPVERFRALMELLNKEEDKRRKQFVHDHPAG